MNKAELLELLWEAREVACKTVGQSDPQRPDDDFARRKGLEAIHFANFELVEKINRALWATEDDYVAWARYDRSNNDQTIIMLCDSDAPGAFKVYRRK